MPYVIVKMDTPKQGQYVSRSGEQSSYTPKMERAKKWSSRAGAEREACGNERVAHVSELVGMAD